ncbi:hypothetical protein [Kribbella sp. DT2]|uniref:hypothetical protein n=1 Tax=Kribbella sp. DT2 TaxID=3393427 RepID=UPI003CFB61EE
MNETTDQMRLVAVLTTQHAARRPARSGFDTCALATWESWKLTNADETLTIESMPGIHGRGLLRTLLPPVMGSLL